MKLSDLEIKNYRSIKHTSIKLLDRKIANLIGANGSGKSNLLKALMALKGDQTTPSDDDFHADTSDDDDQPIVITATIVMEDGDAATKEAAGLKNFNFSGFKVTVEKVRSEIPTIGYEEIGYQDIRPDNIRRLQKELVNAVKILVVDPSMEATKQTCLDKFQEDIDSETATANSVAADFTAAFEPLKAIIPAEVSEKVAKRIADLKAWLGFDIRTQLAKLFARMSIELLRLDSYVIEDRALIAELQDRTAHPFLYDLLLLANKKANDFNANNTPKLSRITKQASKQLSTSISSVWTSHDLQFEIDKQGDSLEFMVFTPQGHQVSLTDLSDGEQWFLKFFTRLAIAQKEKKQVIWLFDEPGRDLHTSSQVDLKSFFETISETSQVIYTSHLAMMVPWHRLERIFAVENSQKAGTIVHTRFWKDTKLDSPLKEALSTFVGEELFGGNEHLIVEGISDYFFLQGWMRYFQTQDPAKAWAENYALHKRIFIPVDGIDKIPLYCWFLGREVKKKINWVVIVDSAAESDSTSKKMTGTGLGSWTKNIKSIGEAAGGKNAAVEEIEGIFKPEEYSKLFESFYKETYPACQLPTYEEIEERQKTVPKITKAIEQILVEKNPTEKKEDGTSIALDKTGIAQYAYKSLVDGKSSFSKETENKFSKIFDNIEKTFNNEVDEVAEK